MHGAAYPGRVLLRVVQLRPDGGAALEPVRFLVLEGVAYEALAGVEVIAVELAVLGVGIALGWDSQL